MIVNEDRSLLVLPNTTISYHYTTTDPYPTMTQLNPFKQSAEDMEPIVSPSVTFTSTDLASNGTFGLVQRFAGPAPQLNPWWDVRAKYLGSKALMDAERQKKEGDETTNPL
jgi:hypothetical protein